MKLIHGDNTKILKTIADNSIDMVLTSPPYDNLRSYDGAPVFSWERFETIAKELYRVLKNNKVVIWVVGDCTENGNESGTSFRQALYFQSIGFKLYDTMIYRKINFVPLTHRRYEQCFEYMFCFSKGIPDTFNPIMERCKNAGKLEKYGAERRSLLDNKQAMRSEGNTYFLETKDTKQHSNIFEYTVGADKSGHPAAFPIKLAEDQIRTWSNKNDLILDPFMGSGTTGIACFRHERNFMGIECVERYYNLAKQRLEKNETECLF